MMNSTRDEGTRRTEEEEERVITTTKSILKMTKKLASKDNFWVETMTLI